MIHIIFKINENDFTKIKKNALNFYLQIWGGGAFGGCGIRDGVFGWKGRVKLESL